MMQEFLRDDRTYATAVTLVEHEDEAVRRLGIVFNLVDKATWQFLADEITKVNILRVEYPTTRYDLAQDRREVVYFLSGWLLSSALSHVTRHKRDCPAFTSFVNSHQYEDAAQFVKVHPGLKGLEREVDRRNVKWRGLSLIFADASFFEFVYTLEDGYLHALKQPALFATYQGDLPAKILEVVSSATPVKMAFRRCVDSIRKEAGKGVVMRSYGVLFDFFLLKWHNMRMADYVKKLSNAQKVVKQRKDKSAEKGGDKGALRERLKSMVNKKTGVRTETRKPTTPERQKRVDLADSIGSRDFMRLTKGELGSRIKACGGVVSGRERQYGLRSMLRAIAPGVGEDVDPACRGESKQGEVTQIALQAFLWAQR
ncbi:unnamed protein product [Ectocarpus sp. CCAP 1310/34]|nr:unnamed protein product [Ectocarpus sp. CCAP 1310/34]